MWMFVVAVVVLLLVVVTLLVSRRQRGSQPGPGPHGDPPSVHGWYEIGGSGR